MNREKSKFNLATLLFAFSGVIILGYIVVYFMPITNDAYVVQNITTVNASANGVIQNLQIKNGQTISENQALMEIHPAQANADYMDSVAKHTQATLDVNLSEQQIKVLQLDLMMAKDELTRLQDEYLIAKSESNVHSKAINQLSYTIKNQHKQIEKINQQIEIAQLQLNKAKINIKDINQSKEKALLDSQNIAVKANGSGIVQNLQVHNGSSVNDGQKLFDFIDASQTIIKADFSETDLSSIHNGAKVIVVTRAYLTKKIFHGEIIANDTADVNNLNPQNNSASVPTNWVKQPHRIPVMIRILDNDDSSYKLVAGMSAYVYVSGN